MSHLGDSGKYIIKIIWIIAGIADKLIINLQFWLHISTTSNAIICLVKNKLINNF